MFILSYVRIAVLSLVLLLDQFSGESFRRLLWIWRRRRLNVLPLTIPSGRREMIADFYFAKANEPRAALLLIHGVLETGKDDPRLVRLAKTLANCGFAVLVPELNGLKSLLLDMEESRDITAAFRFMLAREEVDETRAGLFGISFAAGLTLKAASDPCIREHVRFVVSFGGYYDTVNVVRYLTTAQDEFRGYRHVQSPEAFALHVFVKNLLLRVTCGDDRMILTDLLDQDGSDPDGVILSRSPYQLTDSGRAVYELVRNRDPARIENLIGATEPSVQGYLESLSLCRVVPQVKARVLIGHGHTDPLIPSTESLRLADALTASQLVYVAILEIVTHVDARLFVGSICKFLTISLPSCCRFYGLILRILKEQFHS